MDQKAPDPKWQQLQNHLEGFLSRTLRGGQQGIEYKPRFIGQLQETPSRLPSEPRERTP